MTKLATALFLPLALAAQTAPNTNFQYAVTFNGPEGPGSVRLMAAPQALRTKPVVGKPMSGVEIHSTVQILADGTRIENKTTDNFYRDDQGRTRIERQDGESKTVTVEDPVGGSSAELHGGKMVRVFSTKGSGEHMGVGTGTGVSSGYAYSVSGDPAVATKQHAELGQLAYTSLQLADKVKAEAVMKDLTARKEAVAKEQRTEENLGVEVVDTVSTQHTRTTTTIPQGQIGNDRPINIVSERWFSPDLQMLIKSVNKDPRFGETTYEMTNIVQSAQDPALFQVPAGRLGDTVR
jgi:hypothetical protein